MGRRGVIGLGEGFKVGAIVGFLFWVCADFTLYGVENVSNLTRTVVDPLLEVVHRGIGGAVIALVVSRTVPAPCSREREVPRRQHVTIHVLGRSGHRRNLGHLRRREVSGTR